MQEDIAERIRKSSGNRVLRIVVDERLPDGSLRVLVSKMKPGVADDRKHDSSSWEEEEAHYISPKHASELLPGRQVAKIAEGHVFEIKKGKLTDIYSDERKRVKEKTARLLVREGKSLHGNAKERW